MTKPPAIVQHRLNKDIPKRNILLIIEYHGGNFEGWQIQALGRTVQGVLGEALGKFLRHEVKLTGAGRTDSGVHAIAQYANFLTTSPLTTDQIGYKLCRMLPSDIAIHSCHEVPIGFDARRSAIRRSYRYLICEKKSAIYRELAWVTARRIDLELLKSLANVIKIGIDFGNFCKTKSLKENSECRIDKAAWSRREGFLRFEITANRFLHNMVRLLVGAMIAVNDGHMEEEHFIKLVNSTIKEKVKYIAPAQGLYLAGVEYERGNP